VTWFSATKSREGESGIGEKLYTIQRKGYKVCNNSIFEVAIVANQSVNIVIASEKSMKARTLPPFLTG
jgi:hypothetical protein